MAITDRPSASPLASPISLGPKPRFQVADLRAVWAAWRRRRCCRRDLRRLLRVGPHMIKDIGLTLEEASREVAKPFWRA